MTERRSERWVAIASGDLAAQAGSAIDEIARSLHALHHGVAPPTGPATLGADDPFAILFHAYLAKASTGARAADHAALADLLMERAIDALAQGIHQMWLHGGMTGVAWTATHVTALADHLGDDDPEGEDPNEDLDDAVVRCLPYLVRRRSFDVMSGLVGVGVYFLERLPCATARAAIAKVVDGLTELVDRTPQGTAWRTQERYDLGLAHGIAGIVSFLAELVRADADPRAPALLESTVRWLWAQVRPPTYLWRFPYTIRADTGYAADRSRLAWCYGDLGVSLALLNAARSTGNRAWASQAIEVALHAAQCPPESSSVTDATLCHGAAGNAHLFNRLFQATRCARFEEAALYWFRRTLAFREPGKPFGGYALRPQHADSGDHTLGFLQGVAGIGLALLAGTSALAPDWDRVLLVSVAPS